MNILMLRPQIEAGGAAQSILLLSQQLAHSGYHVAFAAHSGHQLSVAQSLGLAVHLLPLHPTSLLNLWRSVGKLNKIVQQEKIDVLHSHHRFSNLVCRFTSYFTGVPTVSTVHEIKHNQLWLTRFGMGQQVITFSQAVRNHLVSKVGLSPNRVSVVSMGIRQQLPTEAQINQARQLLCQANVQSPVIACIARLSEEKGVDVLLQALHQVKAHNHPFLCYIVGDGPQAAYLQHLSNQLALNDRVHFLGWQENVAGLIANVDFLVLQSRSEGLGLVVLEGMVQAKPTIASRVGGLPEIIQDGQTGLLVPPNNPILLAEAIVKLMHQPEWQNAMGQAGQRVVQNFSVEKMVAQTEAVYRRVCAAG